MQFELTDEQKMIRDMAADFAGRELAPVAARLDETKDRPILVANLKKMAELGLMSMNIPEEYGGADVGAVAYSLAVTEIARACASTAVTMSVTNMVAEVILEFGAEEQKRKYIPKLASGEYSAGAFGLTEAQAGSDPGNMRTTAVRDGDDFVLNGSKMFISSAEYAGVFVVWAVTDKNAGKGRGISVFLIEPGTAGFTVGKDEEKMGQRASSTNQLGFDDCRLPATQLLGRLHEGFPIALMELDGGRIGIASLSLGIGLAAMDFATNYAKERVQFGQPIANFQAIQWMIADGYTELEAARMLIMRAAWLKENGRPFTREAAMAKVYASEAANRACYKAVQMLGGYGYTRDFPVERLARDVRVTTLYEGTSEIQRLVIARDLLK
ncbi:MAG: acyl-CoA dehydrogenase family protein [Deltaproteobacteria bacterium]|nr:acyl-CoA dehydrogenase family protein [Deltaproteobacteria bacterium]